MDTQSGNAHLHNMWGEIALITAVTINSFGVVLMLYSAAGISAISSVPYAFSLVLPRLTLGTWTYISGRTYSHPHDHEKEIRSPISVQLHSWFRIWQDAGYP